MSYAFDLGIDCGSSERLADQALAYFADFEIPLPGNGSVVCDNYGKAERLDHWFIGIYPHGMGYGVEDCRPELVEEPWRSIIRNALYDRLAHLSGFRRALFGSESFDSFQSCTPDELSWINLPDMIYAEVDFPEPPTGFTITPFVPGYFRVVET